MIPHILSKTVNTRGKRLIAFGQLCFAVTGIGILDEIHTVRDFTGDPKFPEYVQKHNGNEKEAIFARFQDKYGPVREEADACAITGGAVLGTLFTISGLAASIQDLVNKRRKPKINTEVEG